MTQRTVPWWRRALSFALGGIVGLFRRNGNRDAGAAAPAPTFVAAQQSEEQETDLDQPTAETRVNFSTSHPEPVESQESLVPDFQQATEDVAPEIAATQNAPLFEVAAPEIKFVEPIVVQTIELPPVEASAETIPIAAPDHIQEADRAPEPVEVAVETVPGDAVAEEIAGTQDEPAIEEATPENEPRSEVSADAVPVAAPDDVQKTDQAAEPFEITGQAAAENEIHGEIAEEPCIDAEISSAEPETLVNSELPQESGLYAPAQTGETTPPPEAASAEDMPESLEIASKAASEITDEFERQTPQEEESASD
ncbi:MAG: hypothetical protein ACRD3S_20430, partial [Terracidiphilus sp.]